MTIIRVVGILNSFRSCILTVPGINISLAGLSTAYCMFTTPCRALFSAISISAVMLPVRVLKIVQKLKLLSILGEGVLVIHGFWLWNDLIVVLGTAFPVLP